MNEWDGNESSCACDCGFDIPKGGTLDTLTLKDITGIANMIYPIGSIYMSINAVDPSTLFGGTWERIQDRFLLAAGASHSSGSIGGSELHSHASPVGYNTANNSFGVNYAGGSTTAGISGAFRYTGDTMNVGSGTFTWDFPHTSIASNMPPYLAVYVWQRTA